MGILLLTDFLTRSWWFILINLLYLPTFAVESHQTEKRIPKRFARYLGGIGLGIFFVGLFSNTIDLQTKLILIFNIIIAYIIFRVLRRGKNKRDLCKGCEELNQKGICSGLHLEAEAEKKYSDFATQLLYPDIEALVFRKSHQ